MDTAAYGFAGTGGGTPMSMTSWNIPLNESPARHRNQGGAGAGRLRQEASSRLADLLTEQVPGPQPDAHLVKPQRDRGPQRSTSGGKMHQTRLSDMPSWPRDMKAAHTIQGISSWRERQELQAHQATAGREQDWVDIADKLEIYGLGPGLPYWDADNLSVKSNYERFRLFIIDLAAMNSGA
jgi:hypothetical protein